MLAQLSLMPYTTGAFALNMGGAHLPLADCRDVLWAQEADSAVPQEDMGGVHWGLLHHHCGLLVPGWLHVQVQMDDLPTNGGILLSSHLHTFSCRTRTVTRLSHLLPACLQYTSYRL